MIRLALAALALGTLGMTLYPAPPPRELVNVPCRPVHPKGDPSLVLMHCGWKIPENFTAVP